MNTLETVCVREVRLRGRICKRFPMVVNRDGIALLDVMRFLINLFTLRSSESTLWTYAAHLRDFHEQLVVNICTVGDMTTEFLNCYRDSIEKRASRPYAAQVLRTVLAYLHYLEQRGAIKGVIGETRGYAIVIRVKANGSIAHSLSEGGATPKSNYYPSDRAIQLIKEFGPKDPVRRERFEIMIDWAHVKGLRAKEVCALVLSQLPDETSLNKALEENRSLEVRLTVTKGSKPRNIDVHPLLLIRTKKWVEVDRQILIRSAMRRAMNEGRIYIPTDYIFVSEITGDKLSTRSVSNSVREAFKKAVACGELTNAERVWLHGLRKRMVNREIDGRPVREKYSRENSLRQETGHGSLDALGRYVGASP